MSGPTDHPDLVGLGGTREISELDLVWLTTMSMNASPVHLDDNLARTTEFGSPVMVGALTVAMALGLAAQAEPALAGSILGWESIRLTGAVRLHDRLTVETSVLGERADAQRVLTRAFVGGSRVVAEIVTLCTIEAVDA